MLESTADALAKRLSEAADVLPNFSESQLAGSQILSALDEATGSQQQQEDGSEESGEVANAVFAAAAALQRADVLQLQCGALAGSEVVLDAIMRILKARTFHSLSLLCPALTLVLLQSSCCYTDPLSLPAHGPGGAPARWQVGVVRVVQAARDGQQLGPVITGGAARGAMQLLTWRRAGLDAQEPEPAALAELAQLRQRLTKLLEDVLENSLQVQVVACPGVCGTDCEDLGACTRPKAGSSTAVSSSLAICSCWVFRGVRAACTAGLCLTAQIENDVRFSCNGHRRV